MRKTSRKGIEVLRSPKPCNSTERDQLYRKLTALAARRSSIAVQLKSYEERVDVLKEMLQKAGKEESELANLLKSNIRLSSNDGGDRRQPSLSETVGHMGKKEMVFRF
jgi:hypothetical protein